MFLSAAPTWRRSSRRTAAVSLGRPVFRRSSQVGPAVSSCRADVAAGAPGRLVPGRQVERAQPDQALLPDDPQLPHEILERRRERGPGHDLSVPGSSPGDNLVFAREGPIISR